MRHGRGRFGCSLVTLAAIFVVGHSVLPANDQWPQFRGADSRGVSDNTNLPDHWSDSENVAWKVPVAGRAWSSPIVWNEQIFVTTVVRSGGDPEAAKPGLYFGGNRPKPDAVEHDWRILCLDLNDGHEVWSKSLFKGIPEAPRHLKNSYLSETPVTDGKYVYVLIGDLGLFCLTMDGNIKWKQNLLPRKMREGWGTAASPVVHQGRIYMVSDSEDESYIAAIDGETGQQLWRTEREEKSNWSTPYVWQNDLRTELVVPGSAFVRSYDLDGNELYRFSGCSTITIATPYSDGGLLYVSSGYVGDKNRPVYAVRPGAMGDITLAEDDTSGEFMAWCQKDAAPYNPSTIVYDGQLYVLHDRGFVTSFDSKTGEPVYGRQRLSNGRAFTASPWACNDRIFCLNEFGETFVIQAGPEFKLLHSNKLGESEMWMATPAIVGNRLLLRGSEHLYCIQRTE